MRRFDPKLDDAEVSRIAAAIDEQNAGGAALRSKRRPLRNSDAPVTRFELPE